MFRNTMIALLTALAALALPASAAELKGWVSRSDKYPDFNGFSYFLKEIKSRTKGRFDTQLVTRETIPEQKQAMTLMGKGDLDFAVVTNGVLSNLVPKMDVLSLPFVFSDERAAMSTLEGPLGKDLEQAILNKGYVVLAWYDGGARSFYTNRPVQFADGFSGMKIRVFGSRSMREMVDALDAKPLVFPYDQVPAAFEAGTIDAAESDIISYEFDGMYKYAKNFFFTNHNIQIEALLMPVAAWDKLSEEDKKIFLAAAKDSVRVVNQQWKKERRLARARLEKLGVNFYDMRTPASFLSRMRPTYNRVLQNPESSEMMLRIMSHLS